MKKLSNVKIQKKVLILIIAVLLIMFGTAAGIVISRLNGKQSVVKTNKANVSWYNESEDEFTITTVEELYDLAALSDFYDFEGQTILLGADLVINEGDAADWAENAPENTWFPIQGFAGTFDGQGHTISGIYGYGISTPMGLFSDTSADCDIRDFKLVNSYFYADGSQGVGSITSNGSGTFEKIYSDAIVSTTHFYAGGLIGRVDSGRGSSVIASSSKISDCWFDGEINLISEKSRMGGGLIGAISNGTVRANHCLSTAKINCPEELQAWRVGGFCGAVGVIEETNKKATMFTEDCLSVAEIRTNYTPSIGSFIGNVPKGATVTYNNTYAEKSVLRACGADSGTLNGAVLELKTNCLVGQEAYRWTTLDFNKYWTVIADKTPELTSFTEGNVVDVTNVKKAYNMDWYDEEAKEFVIDTVEELYGLQMLCNQKVTFEGKTVKLGADIVINEGKATDWAQGKNLPALEWVPIGGGGNNYMPFSGTFDGQGHSISGLYLKSDDQYLGLFGTLAASGCSTIKNLKLTNSYLESTRTEPLASQIEGLGSIAGQGAGTFDTVYSDAIVVSTTSNTGGLIGNHRQPKSPLSVTNCWFDGRVTGVQFVGGIIGYVHGDVDHTNMKDCLVTANLTSTMEEGKPYLGGLSGRITTGNVDSCLVVGEFKGNENICGLIGLTVSIKGELSITHCYNATNVTRMYELGPGGSFSFMLRNVKVEDIKGTNGYVNTLLSFYDKSKNKEGRWVAVKDKTPQLKSFTAGKTLNISGLARAVMNVDVSWYDASKNTYSLKNVEQLYGFAELCNGGITFAGKTVKLTKDIKVNEGKATDWAEGKNLPKNTWTPIGTDTDWAFAGTFDGQGHTISGIYLSSDERYLGLFGVLNVKGSSVVKNLKLTNSYMECTRTEAFVSQVEGLGSIAGQACGTLDTIYSDAIIVNNCVNTGGLVGNHRQPGQTLTVTNCWFDGSVTSGVGNITSNNEKFTPMDWVGGIIGYVHGDVKETNVTDCLVTADLTSKYVRLDSSGNNTAVSFCGGISGRLAHGTIQSCVLEGKISVERGYCRSIVGMNVKNTTSIKQCYNATNATTHYHNVAPALVNVKNMNAKQLTGTEAYVNTLLKFYDKNTNATGRWVVCRNDIVQLRSFAKSEYVADLSELSGVDRALVAETAWADDKNKTEYTISTVEELYGLAELCNEGNTFAGKTIKLGADIKVNDGKATDWAKGRNIPSNKWTPIGTDTDWAFAGTFDGQGHTISGIYLSSDERYLGLFGVLNVKGSSTIKNLKLTNSYLECTRTEAFVSQVEGLGSIAGQACGTLDTIYSDAIIVNNCVNTGGLVGNHRQPNQTLTVTNCWFDGSVTSGVGNITSNSINFVPMDWVGGIIGYVHGDVRETNVTDCLMTADITSKYVCLDEKGNNTAVSFCGGISGRLAHGTIQSCVLEGKLSVERGYVRSIVGMNVKNTLSIKECYNTTNASTHYYNVAPSLVDVKNLTTQQLAGKETYMNTALDFYDKNTNANGKWVIFTDDIVQLRSFAKEGYITDLNELGDLSRPIVADTSWYGNGSMTEYTINTAEQLYGLAELCNAGNTFAGKTIKLGATIKVNNGKASDWAQGKDIPNNRWIPIGNSESTYFAGTFDGQGHSIEGLYLESDGLYLGLFGVMDATGKSTVKNLKLTNSYMKCTRTGTTSKQTDGLGSIAGQGAGLFDTISSDTILVSTADNTGGLIGSHALSGSLLSITNCRFNGEVTGKQWVGGIVGYVHGGVYGTYITDCLVMADLTGTNNVGGISGRANGGCIDSCVVKGNLSGTSNVHGILGQGVTLINTNPQNSLVISKCYYISNVEKSHYSNVVSITVAPTVSHVLKKSDNDLKGTLAYSNTLLDFYVKDANEDGKWVAIKNGLPELRSFADSNDIDEVSQLTRTVTADTSWYGDGSKTEYTICTANELYGLAKLCNEGNKFIGKTIKLGSDIKVNYGKATDWKDGKSLPNNEWIPIGGGTTSRDDTKYFVGTFDGQGHTISGLYMNSNGRFLGLFGFTCINDSYVSTIKNLRLVNGYFKSTATDTHDACGFGSVVGRGEGTIDTVYSDVVLEGAAIHTGGLVGTQFRAGSQLNITNSWYDGEIHGSAWVGGLVGFTYYHASNIPKTHLTDCLVTADMTGTNYVGGLVGRSTGGKYLSCVATGTLTGSKLRGFVGNHVGNGTLAIEKCYHATNATTEYEYGSVRPTLTNSQKIENTDLLKDKNAYENTLLDFSEKVTTGRWVAIKGSLLGLKSFVDENQIVRLDNLIVADTSWYGDGSASEYTISTAAELYGLAKLCNEGNKFIGKTIKLGADIKVNDGKATDWAQGKDIPLNEWIPIGGGTTSRDDTKYFVGTFDGQGHTISGLYMNSDGRFLGLFGFTCINDSYVSTIKNLRLVNGYFKSTATDTHDACGFGSVVGRGEGTIDTVYSDVVLEGAAIHTGGLVGTQFRAGSQLNITNSWYDGEIHGSTWVGGLVGFTYYHASNIPKTYLTDCLVTADMTGTNYVGGLVGRSTGGKYLSCVATGTLTGSKLRGFVGNHVGNGTLAIEKCYHATNATTEYEYGSVRPTLTNSTQLTSAQLTDKEAYLNTLLDFDGKVQNGKWVAIKDSLLQLRGFSTQDLIVDLSNVTRATTE